MELPDISPDQAKAALEAHVAYRRAKCECEWCMPPEPLPGHRAAWVLFGVVYRGPHQPVFDGETQWLCPCHFWKPEAEVA